MFSQRGLGKNVWLRKGSQRPHAPLTSLRGSSWRSPGAAQTLANVICSLSHSSPALSSPATWPGSLPRVRALSLGTAPPTGKPGSPSRLPPPWWLHSQSVENHNKNHLPSSSASLRQPVPIVSLFDYDLIPKALCILFRERPIWSAYGLPRYSRLAILTTFSTFDEAVINSIGGFSGSNTL